MNILSSQRSVGRVGTHGRGQQERHYRAFNGSHNLEVNPEARKLLCGVCIRCANTVGLNWQHLCIPFLVIRPNVYCTSQITIITSLVSQKQILHSWKITKKKCFKILDYLLGSSNFSQTQTQINTMDKYN